MKDPRDFFEDLVYRTVDRRRYTQQSPVMPDVWIQYGLHPGEQLELLIVPDWHYTPAQLARELKARLAADEGNRRLNTFRRSSRDDRPAAVAHNQNIVVATLWFDQLVRAVLPLSQWWVQSVADVSSAGDTDQLVELLDQPAVLVEALRVALEELDPRNEKRPRAGRVGVAPDVEIRGDVAWLARVAGLVTYLSSKTGREGASKAGRTGEAQVRYLTNQLKKSKTLARMLVELLRDLTPVEWENWPLYSVNLNRKTTAALHDSLGCVKADAAHRVFDVRGARIRWAIIDSGIDARHTAFRKRDRDHHASPVPFAKRPKARRRGRSIEVSGYRNETRIVATYDFVHVRELLSCSPEDVEALDRTKFPVLETRSKRTELKRILQDLESHAIDWERLEPFLEIPHTPNGIGPGTALAYRPPGHRHGTHVAGILGAEWRAKEDREDAERLDTDAQVEAPPGQEDLIGVCPEIELYDLRALDDDGMGDEFSIMSALQFVRDLNNRKDFMAIHGVNLSFSIEHDVANYACGRTPVCDEAERLVGSGVVVVTAAGNSGRARYLTPAGTADDGFRTVSITDPGNADAVITVGATHRRDAHTYGVSYFSSRGPTGDGRLKPDLVAPGEKILSTVPGNRQDRLDGTSMAAPHVSGAAALILARHSELIGQPRRVKEILCRTATDLGRERYFQGSGLLDILRALESI